MFRKLQKNGKKDFQSSLFTLVNRNNSGFRILILIWYIRYSVLIYIFKLADKFIQRHPLLTFLYSLLLGININYCVPHVLNNNATLIFRVNFNNPVCHFFQQTYKLHYIGVRNYTVQLIIIF